MEAGGLTLEQAAGELGVHYHTAYRWVRRGVLPAVKRNGAYEVGEQAVRELLRRREQAVPAPVARQVRSWPRRRARFFDALVSGDETRVREEVDGLAGGGVPIGEVCDHLLAPALRRLGEAWAQGVVGLAEEHRASAICMRALARWSTAPPGRPRGVAVVCSAPGDEHELPAAMATAVLRDRHFTVHHLGAGLPPESIVGLAEAEGASLVVVSSVFPPAGAAAQAVAGRLGALGIRALVGAPGATSAELVALSERPPAQPAPARDRSAPDLARVGHDCHTV